MGLIAFIPYSRLRHAVTGPLNIYQGNLGAKGALDPLDLKPGHTHGASCWTDFTWKQLLDTDACMECGRCEEQCPATASGKALSPQKVLQDIRRQVKQDRSRPGSNRKDRRQQKDLIGDILSEDEIWACTTCYACQEVCPVFAEPPRVVIDLRRHQVLEKSRFPKELGTVFRKLEIFGDTYGKGPARKIDWAKNEQVRDLAAVGSTDVLLWIGCEGAFHERSRKTASSLVRILNKAGLDYAILGKQERCCGDLPRRTGNEHLFQRLARGNIELLRDYGIKRIISLCPHCFHTLKNEYPPLGGNFSVVHYTEILVDLITRGDIKLEKPVPGKALFHDPCYLGRVNGLYQVPRRILKAVPGLQLEEMVRSEQKSFCCGAGGGRVWLHEQPGERINRLRADEAVAIAPESIITSCPYCLSMLEDGLSAMEGKDLPTTWDLAEFILQAME